jgi:hypothetical protein
MDINNINLGINDNKLTTISSVDKIALAVKNSDLKSGDNLQLKNKSENVSETIKTGEKASSTKILKELSLPVNKTSLAVVDTMTKMGKQLDKNSINSMIKSLPTLINQFGEANTKSIVLLKLLNINVSTQTIELGNFILNSMGKEFSTEILNSLNSISEMLPEFFKKFAVKSELGKDKLFLKLDSKISSSSIQNLFKMLGYMGKNQNSISNLVRLLSIMSQNSEEFAPISEKEKFSVYPNPASFHIYISLPDNLQNACVLKITNVLGSIVYASEIESNIELNVDFLPNGLYNFELVGNGRRYQNNIIISR